MDDLDALLPADLALPEGVPAPISDEVLDHVAGGGWPEVVQLEHDAACEWTMRRLAGLNRFVTRQREQRDAWKQRVDDWYDRTTTSAERMHAYLETVCQHYAIAQRGRRGRSKMVKVPSGEIWTRGGKDEPRIVLDDKDALLAFLIEALDEEAYEAVVRITRDVRVGALAERATFVAEVVEEVGDLMLVVLIDGKRVPGVHAVPSEVSSGVRLEAGLQALETAAIEEALR